MPRMRRLLPVFLAFPLAACASDPPPGDDVPEDYVPFIEADWTMPAGTEGYWCARVTVAEDLYVKGFRAVAPPGTHHTALGMAGSTGPDGTFPCEASTVGFQMLFGSGVGTAPFEMPEGVAYKIPAGEQVLLNLHLFNTTTSEMTGTSGIDLLLASEDEIEFEAETAYIGTFEIEIPPGEVTQTARCTMQADATIFGVFPHMHKLGTHIRGVVHESEEETDEPRMLIDQGYSFEEQLNYDVAPGVEVRAGDVVRADCTFDNPGPGTVGFGDSTDDEMCVLGVYRYPARGGISICFN
jgi:hypothetical protein